MLSEPSRATGTSLTSFHDAAAQALDQIPGDPDKEGLVDADVTRQWVQKGGVVGQTQYHVELTVRPSGDSAQTEYGT